VTSKELARILVEKLADANIHKKIAVFVNRMMLRLHSQPALLANLSDVTVFKPGADSGTKDQVEDGEFQESLVNEEATADDTPRNSPNIDRNTPDNEYAPNKEQQDADNNSAVLVQLSFRRLPQEVIAPLIRLIAAPRDPKLFRYSKDGSARTGVEIDLKPDDFPGDDYEYSF
jgi:hypothetical protein